MRKLNTYKKGNYKDLYKINKMTHNYKAQACCLEKKVLSHNIDEIKSKW